jgi:hypothetical protein
MEEIDQLEKLKQQWVSEQAVFSLWVTRKASVQLDA